MRKLDRLYQRFDELMKINPDDRYSSEYFELLEVCNALYELTGSESYLSEIAVAIRDTNPEQSLRIYDGLIDAGYETQALYAGLLYVDGTLGYIDYKKGFDYFNIALNSKPSDIGDRFKINIMPVNIMAKIYLSKMYKYGLYVEKDFDMYKKLVNEAYEAGKDEEWYGDRGHCLEAKGMLEIDEGNISEGVKMLFDALSDYTDQVAHINWGYEDMVRVNHLIYENSLFDIDDLDLYSWNIAEHLLQPVKLEFDYDKTYIVESYYVNGELVIEFENDFFSDSIDFYKNAVMDDGNLFRNIMFDLQEWRKLS